MTFITSGWECAAVSKPAPSWQIVCVWLVRYCLSFSWPLVFSSCFHLSVANWPQNWTNEFTGVYLCFLQTLQSKPLTVWSITASRFSQLSQPSLLSWLLITWLGVCEHLCVGCSALLGLLESRAALAPLTLWLVRSPAFTPRFSFTFCHLSLVSAQCDLSLRLRILRQGNMNPSMRISNTPA